MLVLSRKKGERIVIGDDIEVVVVAVEGSRVRLAFSAPAEVPIRRQEVQVRPSSAVQADCVAVAALV